MRKKLWFAGLSGLPSTGVVSKVVHIDRHVERRRKWAAHRQCINNLRALGARKVRVPEKARSQRRDVHYQNHGIGCHQAGAGFMEYRGAKKCQHRGR